MVYAPISHGVALTDDYSFEKYVSFYRTWFTAVVIVCDHRADVYNEMAGQIHVSVIRWQESTTHSTNGSWAYNPNLNKCAIA